MYIHRDIEALQTSRNTAGPQDRPLLELKPWTGVGIRRRPIGEIGIEVDFSQAKHGEVLDRCFDRK
jgi:hypothetical protein